MKNIIIDCHAICHAAKHTLGDLSHEDQEVGIIFGFLKQILSLSKRFNTSKFIFCWDSRKSFRRDIYPQYKIRKRTDDDIQQDKFFFKQFIQLRQYVLPKMGFKNTFIQTGLEADDLIAAITQNYNREFIIVSGDADLYQLLTENVSMFLPRKKKLYTINSFKKEFDILPIDWVMVKRISGCKSDMVKGVVGIGDKRAVQYIKNELNEKTKAYKNIQENSYIIERNRALVELPFEGTKVPKLTDDRFNIIGFESIIDEFGFLSMKSASSLYEWQSQFGMK